MYEDELGEADTLSSLQDEVDRCMLACVRISMRGIVYLRQKRSQLWLGLMGFTRQTICLSHLVVILAALSTQAERYP